MHEENQGKFPTALQPVRFITRTKIASSVPLPIEIYFSIKHREKRKKLRKQASGTDAEKASERRFCSISMEECHGLVQAQNATIRVQQPDLVGNGFNASSYQWIR